MEPFVTPDGRGQGDICNHAPRQFYTLMRSLSLQEVTLIQR